MNKTSTLKNFQIINKLGEGSFSSVYKVRRYDNQLCYALKKVKIGQMCEKEKQNSLNEVRILASISNPHIINYKEAFFDDSSQTLCIVMELAEAGDILKKTNQHIKAHTYFKQAEIWKALIHMTKGLKALHDLNILHRDLKCANVFCTSDGVYKLGDLNVSKVAKKGMARTHTGTPYYTSPEVWKDKPYDSKCDIWSLGCVIYEMAALKPPFRANNLKQLYNKIQKGIFDRIPNFYSDDLHNLITNCMKVNPLQRPNTNQILINPIVIKNMLPTEIYKRQGPQQQNLLKTILVPKNLRALKQFLPSSNYENQLSQSLQKKVVDRISSVRGIGKIINIQTPKISERRYGYVQSPSKILRPESVNRSRDQLSANKKDYFEARKQKPQQSVELLKKQRDKSVELLRPYNLYNPSKQKQMIRNKSKEMLQEISSRKDSSKQKLKIIDNTRDRNLQLRRNHSQISRNVEKAVEAVRRLQTNESNKLILPVRRVADSSNKPRSQSFQKQNNRYNLRINPAIIKPENRYLNDKKQLPPRQLKL